MKDGAHNNNQQDKQFTRDRFLMNAKDGGGGIRLTTERTTFINTCNRIFPMLVGTSANTGYWKSLKTVLGERSFYPENNSTRWDFLFNNGSEYGAELKTQVNNLFQLKSSLMTLLINDTSVDNGPIQGNENAFGANIIKLSKAIGDQMRKIKVKTLMKRALAMRRDDPRRMAFLAVDQFSTQLMAGLPSREEMFTKAEYQEAVANNFAQPSPICRNIVGEHIRNNRNQPQINVDEHGMNLKLVAGTTGDHIRTFHDAIVTVVMHGGLRDAKIPHKGGNNETCKNEFEQHIRLNQIEIVDNDHHDENNHRRNDRPRHNARQGIIPDIIIDTTNVQPFNESELNGKKTIWDCKTLAPGLCYTENTSTARNTVTEKREKKVTMDYHAKAKELDMEYNGTRPEEIGPVEQHLRSFGTEGKVYGFVVGAYGEGSPAVSLLRDLIVDSQAASLCNMLNIPLAQAKSIYQRKVTRKWALIFARGWARVLLNRRYELVGGGTRPVPHGDDIHSEADFTHEVYAYNNQGRLL
jgi:hypothetical protein